MTASIRSAVVASGALRPNRWNPNRMDKAMFRKEVVSIRTFGFVNPVIVWELSTDTYEIIDGEHRWRAAMELGLKDVPITIVDDIIESQAKQLTIVLNETRGRTDPERLGDLLQDLLTTETKAALLDVLPIEPMVFDKLTGLTDFDWSVFEKPPTEKKSSWVERTYRMPEDAALVLDQALEAARDGEGIEDWQAIERVAADYLAGSSPENASTSVTPNLRPTVRA